MNVSCDAAGMSLVIWTRTKKKKKTFCGMLQEVVLKGRSECSSIPPPQYYSQLISEMETLGWNK